MGLFNKNTEPVQATPPPPQKKSLFGRNKNTTTNTAPMADSRTSTSSARSNRSSGIFGRKRSISPAATSTRTSTSSAGTGLFSRRHEDPSTAAARDRVMAAEAAERDADRALAAAKLAVRDARSDVRNLNTEAELERKAALRKANDASDLEKRAKPLGRHGRIF